MIDRVACGVEALLTDIDAQRRGVVGLVEVVSGANDHHIIRRAGVDREQLFITRLAEGRHGVGDAAGDIDDHRGEAHGVDGGGAIEHAVAKVPFLGAKPDIILEAEAGTVFVGLLVVSTAERVEEEIRLGKLFARGEGHHGTIRQRLVAPFATLELRHHHVAEDIVNGIEKMIRVLEHVAGRVAMI